MYDVNNLRACSHLSRAKFAKSVGTCADVVYKWERGVTKPSVEKLCVICNIFNVSIETMLDPRGEFAKEDN